MTFTFSSAKVVCRLSEPHQLARSYRLAFIGTPVKIFVKTQAQGMTYFVALSGEIKTLMSVMQWPTGKSEKSEGAMSMPIRAYPVTMMADCMRLTIISPLPGSNFVNTAYKELGNNDSHNHPSMCVVFTSNLEKEEPNLK
ncbi:hypothetical protein ACTXT7_010584 [Hymenolepis weldensis]